MKNISEKKFYRLERKLDYKDYHLNRTIEPKKKKPVVTKWALYRNFENEEIYFSENNKPILTSEKNSYKELKKYVNEHKRIDVGFVMCEISRIYTIIIWIFCFINIFILREQQIKKYIIMVMIGIIISQFINLIIEEITFKRELKSMREKINHKSKILILNSIKNK